MVDSCSESLSLTSSPVLTSYSGNSAASVSRISSWLTPGTARTATLVAFSPSVNRARACAEVKPTPT